MLAESLPECRIDPVETTGKRAFLSSVYDFKRKCAMSPFFELRSVKCEGSLEFICFWNRFDFHSENRTFGQVQNLR